MTPPPPFISFIKKQEKWSGVGSLSVPLSSLEIFLRKQFLEIQIEHVSTGYLQLYTFADKKLNQ